MNLDHKTFNSLTFGAFFERLEWSLLISQKKLEPTPKESQKNPSFHLASTWNYIRQNLHVLAISSKLTQIFTILFVTLSQITYMFVYSSWHIQRPTFVEWCLYLVKDFISVSACVCGVGGGGRMFAKSARRVPYFRGPSWNPDERERIKTCYTFLSNKVCCVTSSLCC